MALTTRGARAVQNMTQAEFDKLDERAQYKAVRSRVQMHSTVGTVDYTAPEVFAKKYGAMAQPRSAPLTGRRRRRP